MKTKAVYEGDVLKPIEKLNLKEGEVVEIEVKKSIVDRTYGLLHLDHDDIEEIIEDTKYGCS
jgi:predicted DNA-binding antitoxin AbrB/MazE fold protein